MQNMTKLTDEQLVVAYANGNNKAFDVLLTRHQNRVFTYIMSFVKDEDVANDVFQDTFIKAVTTIRQGRYTENGKFRAWITRIAHNVVIDHFRQVKNAALVSADDAEDNVLNDPTLCDASIEDLMIGRQVNADLRKLINALPETQRRVVLMRYYRDMSFKEIAEETGVSINTALGRMRYALLNIRRMARENNIALSL